MNIQGRIKKVEQMLAISSRFKKIITATQKEPNSNIYNIKEHFIQGNINKFNSYTIDDIDKFYKENTADNVHILKIDIVDNSELERYFLNFSEV